MTAVDDIADGLSMMRMGVVRRMGAVVRLCVACGCPLGAVSRGAGVDVSRLVGRRKARRFRALGCTTAEASRLFAWLDWVLAAHAFAYGAGSVEEAAEAAMWARLVGCDVTAWRPGGLA